MHEKNKNHFIKYFAYIILCMKLNGYMVHWFEVDNNLLNTSQVNIITQNLGKYFNINKITHLGKQIKAKRICRWHFVYCLAMLIFKIFGFPILFLVITFSRQAQLYLSGVDSRFYSTILNSTIAFQDKNGIFKVLNNFSEVTFSVQISIYPCIFFIYSILINYFEKTAAAFNLAESELLRCFSDYNKWHDGFNDQKLMYKKKYFLILKLFYGVVCVIFFGGCFQFVLEVENEFTSNYRTTQGGLFNFCFTFSLILFLIDYIISIYFLYVLLVLSIYQFNAFADYVRAIVSDINSGKELYEFDIENIRETYRKLSNYVEHIDSWIRFILLLIYSTSIPSLCTFFYMLCSDNKFSLKKNGTMIFTYLFQLAILTILGAILNLKVIN